MGPFLTSKQGPDPQPTVASRPNQLKTTRGNSGSAWYPVTGRFVPFCTLFCLFRAYFGQKSPFWGRFCLVNWGQTPHRPLRHAQTNSKQLGATPVNSGSAWYPVTGREVPKICRFWPNSHFLAVFGPGLMHGLNSVDRYGGTETEEGGKGGRAEAFARKTPQRNKAKKENSPD